MEIWKDIEGWENFYQISNLGNFRSKDREYVDSMGRKIKRKGSVMNKEVTKLGYERAKMNLNGKSKKEAVHRLVAKAFIPNTENKPCVNHIDCNPLNNKVENLEWVTYSENILHARDNDRLTKIHKIKLYNEKEELIFKSKKEASHFLGKESAYISHMIARGDKEIKGYKYELL